MSPTPGRVPELPGARVAAVAFAVVIVATAASFALAQRLKRQPPLLSDEHALTLFSPSIASGARRARFSFKLQRTDTITTVVTDLAGNPIRTLQRDLHVPRGRQVKGAWNGADDRGRSVADGRYRVRIILRDAGRAVLFPKTFTKDTTPPAPRLLSVGPEKTGGTPRPELLPRADGRPAVIRYRAIGRSRAISVFRTDLPQPKRVLEVPLTGPDQSTWEWDGTVDGHRVPQGTYLVAVHASDLVGNVGWSTGSAEQVPPFGEQLKGAGGITVRYLAAQSSQAPVPAGDRATIGVISAGRQYRWSIRRVGETRARSRGKSRRPLLRPKLPGGPSGLHVLELRTDDRVAQSAIITQGRQAQKVLVVIPAATLIGNAQVDDDGDGSPDTLDRGVTVQTARVPVDPDLPADLADHIAPLLLSLDRKDRRYDLTTDLALARGTGPELRGHSGVVLAGQTEFIDRRLQSRLVEWVKRGGRLWVAEPGSLLRSAVVHDESITQPTQPTRVDPFGFELGALTQASRVDQVGDAAGLLRGTDGRFRGPLTVEPVLRIPTGSRKLAEATTPDGGQPVLSAVTLDRGAVVRTGIEGLGADSLRSPDAREFLRRLWIFLRGG